MSKKKKAEEVEEEEVAPFWMISFSDMMTLLLSFFIILFSVSTIETKKMAELVEAMGGRYLVGHGKGGKATPGKVNPNIPKGKKPLETQDTPLLQEPDKDKTVSGTILLFTLGSDQLDGTNRKLLEQLAAQLQGQPYTIMVKGHASKREETPYRKVDDLAYTRAWNVRESLIAFGLKPELFLLAIAGSYTPLGEHQLPISANVADPNAYVEVLQIKEAESVKETPKVESESQSPELSEPQLSEPQLSEPRP